jgi:hypothetical protein
MNRLVLLPLLLLAAPGCGLLSGSQAPCNTVSLVSPSAAPAYTTPAPCTPAPAVTPLALPAQAQQNAAGTFREHLKLGMTWVDFAVPLPWLNSVAEVRTPLVPVTQYAPPPAPPVPVPMMLVPAQPCYPPQTAAPPVATPLAQPNALLPDPVKCIMIDAAQSYLAAERLKLNCPPAPGK